MKTTLTFLVGGILLASCGVQSQSMREQKNTELVHTFFEHFNAHDWHAMANMYVETADFKDPSFGDQLVKQTRQQILDKYAGLNKTFPDIQDEIQQIYPAGKNHIVVEFVSTGTMSDGSTFTLPICTIFTIKDGLITKGFTYYDDF